MDNDPTPSGLDQLRQLSGDVEQSWEKVVDALRTALIECVEVLSDEELLLLNESFWPASVEILSRHEVYTPGITENVMIRFEEIANERREAEQREFKKGTFPRVKRRAILRNIIGLPSEPIR